MTGKIHYGQADGGTEEGVLLYIKPAIVGGENADIFNYRKTHLDFPHESTVDQWFDEDQFESYRMLGCGAAKAALSAISKDLLKFYCNKGAEPHFRKLSVNRICQLLSQA